MLEKEIRKIKYIAEECADIPLGSIDSKTRKREVVLARQAMCSFLLVDAELSHEKLSQFINRHRTNFYHYEKQHKVYIEDARIYPAYNKLYNKIKFAYFSDEHSILTNKPKTEWLAEIDELNKQQRSIERKMKVLEAERELLSL